MQKLRSGGLARYIRKRKGRGRIGLLGSFNRRDDKSIGALCIGGKLQTGESTFELVIAMS